MSETLLATFHVAGMTWGLPVDSVREVLGDQVLQPVPRAGNGVIGMLNLRGRVLAVTDVRLLVGLPAAADQGAALYVVERSRGLDVLRVDHAGEVVAAQDGCAIPVPQATPAAIAQHLSGALEVEGRLLLVVDLNRLLDAKD